MRYLVFGIILFLPLIVYFTWAYIVTRKQEETGGKWNDGPVTKLFIAGLVLMAGALVVSRFMNPGEPPGRLVPDRYQDDRFLRQPEGESPRPRQSLDGPPVEPAPNAEEMVEARERFVERAEEVLTGFLASGNMELLDTLVTRSDEWGLVMRADYRRRVDGKPLPRERLIIWEQNGNIHLEMPQNQVLAPLDSFPSLND